MKNGLTDGVVCAILVVFEDITFHETFSQHTVQVGDLTGHCDSPLSLWTLHVFSKSIPKEDVLRE